MQFCSERFSCTNSRRVITFRRLFSILSTTMLAWLWIFFYTFYPRIVMFDKFVDLGDKISHLEGKLSDPQLVTDQKEYQKVVREHAHLTKLNVKYCEYRKVQQEIIDNKSILHDENEDQEFKDLAKVELEELEGKRNST